MCGIGGIYNGKKEYIDPARSGAMNNAMCHRGPDAGNCLHLPGISLTHRRLSIIDLSEAANQPMADIGERYHIVFNGEIYNFKSIRAQLPEYHFKTNGDSEVILAAYAKWGKAAIEKLEGMFAFGLYDKATHELMLVRDRMGVKPLYYYISGDTVYFASEIRALLGSGVVPKKIDNASLASFLLYQSVSAPSGMIEGIKQVDAGSYISFRDGYQEIKKYWDITAVQPGGDYSSPAAVKKNIHQLLVQSVGKRLISDVPLGAFLSGGIDSSAIVALMAENSREPVNTFTVGFREKKYDERPFAEVVARKFSTRHHAIEMKAGDFLDDLLPALDKMDIPSGDGINTYVVSKAIRQSGLAVALSGIGGDELFAGYPFFKRYYQLHRLKTSWGLLYPARMLAAGLLGLKRDGKAARLQQLLRQKKTSINNFYPLFRQLLSPALVQQLTAIPKHMAQHSTLLPADMPDVSRFPVLSQVTIADLLGYTQHTLLKDADQMSMAVSLELREPFFDHHLIEYVLGIPDSIKLPTYPKSLLVESLGDLLPAEVVHRKKQGFVFPWNYWMKNELHDFCIQRIRNLSQRNFINENMLNAYWNRFTKGDPSVRWMELWLFVILEYWLEKNDVS